MIKVLALTDPIEMPPDINMSLAASVSDFIANIETSSYDVLVIDTTKVSDSILGLIMELKMPVVAISDQQIGSLNLDPRYATPDILRTYILHACCNYHSTTAFDTLEIGIFSLENAKISYWNKAMECVTGIQKPDAMQKHIKDILETLSYDIKDVDSILNHIVDYGRGSLRLIRSDGTLRYVETLRIAQSSTRSIYQVVDVTPSKAIMSRIRETESRILAILGAVQECVMQFDNTGCITFNQKCLTFLNTTHPELRTVKHTAFQEGLLEIRENIYQVRKRTFALGGDDYTIVTINDVTDLETLRKAVNIVVSG